MFRLSLLVHILESVGIRKDLVDHILLRLQGRVCVEHLHTLDEIIVQDAFSFRVYPIIPSPPSASIKLRLRSFS